MGNISESRNKNKSIKQIQELQNNCLNFDRLKFYVWKYFLGSFNTAEDGQYQSSSAHIYRIHLLLSNKKLLNIYSIIVHESDNYDRNVHKISDVLQKGRARRRSAN